MSETYQNYIGGQWVDAASGETFEKRNPARTSEVIGLFPRSLAVDVDDAVNAAQSAFATWSRVPAPARGDYLKMIGDLLVERKDEIAFEMTREMGKTFTETRGDVQEAIDTAYYSASETRRLFGNTVPSELPNKFNMSLRRPVGVFGIITAWNFPVAVPTWKIFPAIASGNTVVFKPSEEAPNSARLLVKVFEDAGLPAGVVDLNTVPSELPNKFNMSLRRPVGVFGIITAWNFPVAVPTWKIFPAIASGNTVVFKPSEEAPNSARLLVKVFEDAGLPAGVVNLIIGAGEAGRALVDHPGIDGISFTGSTDTGASIAEAAAREHKRVSLEMGGKNPQIVMPDADLDLAVEGVLWGAFGTTGQRCTATSRLLLHVDIHDEVVERVKARAAELRLGYGNDDGIDVGPLINQKALDKVLGYIEIGQQEGAKLVMGGERAEEGALAEGYFFLPTIFADVRPGSRLALEEVFGPVLSVLKFETYEQAIEIANEVRYGLSSSIYTRDVAQAFRAMHDLEAGITYINGPTIGAEAHMPFGGVKQTGNGHREGGWEVFYFYTETKTVYVDYSGRLQKAQIDNVG